MRLAGIVSNHPENCQKSYPLRTQRNASSPREGTTSKSTNSAKISKTSKLQGLHTTQQPLDSPEIQVTISNPRFPGINTARTVSLTQINIGYLHCKHLDIGKNQHQLPTSTTRQQHQTSISFQSPPPGSSTTSASLQQASKPTSC